MNKNFLFVIFFPFRVKKKKMEDTKSVPYFASLVVGSSRDDPHIIDICGIVEVTPRVYILVTKEEMPGLPDGNKFTKDKVAKYCPFVLDPKFMSDIIKDQ